MTDPIRVVVADDHPLMREGIARTLSESGRFEVVAHAAGADEAVALVAHHAPDLAILDISMPGGGIEAARRIARDAPGAKVVMLTVSEADEDIMASLRAGAKGYVLKGVDSATLVEIAEGIAAGEGYVSPKLAARLLTEMQAPGTAGEAEDPLSALTEREEEILRLVSTGLSNKRVALTLDIQEKTVKHHMTRILQKLQVSNRTEAAMKLRDAEARR